ARRTHKARIDIRDLNMSKLPLLESTGNPAVVVAKHLCGLATDLALKALLGLESTRSNHIASACQGLSTSQIESLQMKQEVFREGEGVVAESESCPSVEYGHGLQEGEGRVRGKIGGVAIATCCHHRCMWEDYVGRDFLSNLVS
ncbi:unnamed protein product, partial [Choristocarpus tenellus]